ncbi:MAG TPA: POTRA domain-containing protein [Kofleriaceae bacterium]|jgi:hypothetical protein
MALAAVLLLAGLGGAAALHVWPPAAQADAPAAAAASPTIKGISFEGQRLPEAELRETLRTKIGDALDAAQLERDRAAMQALLAGQGYLAARVAPAELTIRPGGDAYVNFAVDPGLLFHVRRVEVTGAGRDANVVTVSAGDEALAGRFERARQALADALARRGKPARVDLTVETDTAAAVVDVKLATK